MNADELVRKVVAYGADAEEIRDRFGGNVELYARCFLDFLEENNFVELERAMESGDYARAFDAAHALKGISGNLGVKAFYGASCALVETLREKRYAAAGEQYAGLLRSREELASAVLGGREHGPPGWGTAT